MKYTLFITGLILVVINTISGLIFQGYAAHKMLFADFSIILTIGLLYLMYQMRTADGFKIGFTLLFGLTGLTRFICAVSSSKEFKNNYAVLIFIMIFCIECVLIYVSHAMRNK
jgi:hypothetical protein